MSNSESGEPNPQSNNQNPVPQDDDALNKFKEIKETYETKLSDKDKEIEELKKQLKAKDSKIDETIVDLNNEINDKLKQSEEYQKLQKTVEELQKDKAEATVDTYVAKGIILPVQRFRIFLMKTFIQNKIR